MAAQQQIVNPSKKCITSLFLEKSNISKAIKFYKDAFGAVLVEPREEGDIAELDRDLVLKIGETTLHVGCAKSGSTADLQNRTRAGKTGFSIVIYVNDVWKCWKRAEAAGFADSTLLYDPEDPGERMAKIYDPIGYLWVVKRSKSSDVAPTSSSGDIRSSSTV